MYSVLLISFMNVIAAGVCAIYRDEFIKACGNMKIITKCCKDNVVIEPELMTIFKECSQLPGPPMCDQDICLATKRGFGSPDGNVDEAKALKELETYIGKSRNLFAKIKQECFGSNMDKYGPPDQCQAAKLKHCVQLHLLNECKNLSNEGECQGVKDDLDKCTKLFI